METEDIIYRRLQEHINRMPVGFPANQSGADITILKSFFTVDEAKVALELSMLPEPFERIYPRIKGLGYSEGEGRAMLDSMLKKGIIFGTPLLPAKGDKKQFSSAQWVIGMYELNVNRLKKEVLPAMDTYLHETFKNEFLRPGIPVQMRTIPIGKSIIRETATATYDDIRKIILNTSGPIVINNCICREEKDKAGKPCKHTSERHTCIYLKNVARYAIENNMGRVVTRDEVLSELARFEEIGLVVQPENCQDPTYICCCCGDCCGVLAIAKLQKKPTELFYSNYFAVVDSARCDGNGKCMKRCQMGAVIVKDKKAIVNLDRCIGCGLCTTTCRTGALSLQRRNNVKVPPKTHDALYQKILMKKVGPVKAMGVMARYMLGFKV